MFKLSCLPVLDFIKAGTGMAGNTSCAQHSCREPLGLPAWLSPTQFIDIKFFNFELWTIISMQQQFVRLMVTAASILFALDTVEPFEVGPVAPVEIPLSAKEKELVKTRKSIQVYYLMSVSRYWYILVLLLVPARTFCQASTHLIWTASWVC